MHIVIPVLSPYFLYHPHIPHFLIRRIFYLLVSYCTIFILLAVYSPSVPMHSRSYSIWSVCLSMFVFTPIAALQARRYVDIQGAGMPKPLIYHVIVRPVNRSDYAGKSPLVLRKEVIIRTSFQVGLFSKCLMSHSFMRIL